MTELEVISIDSKQVFDLSHINGRVSCWNTTLKIMHHPGWFRRIFLRKKPYIRSYYSDLGIEFVCLETHELIEGLFSPLGRQLRIIFDNAYAYAIQIAEATKEKKRQEDVALKEKELQRVNSRSRFDSL